MRMLLRSTRPLLVAAYGARRIPPNPVVRRYLYNTISWQYDKLSHPDTVFRSRGQRVTALSVPAFSSATSDCLALDRWAALLICVHQKLRPGLQYLPLDSRELGPALVVSLKPLCSGPFVGLYIGTNLPTRQRELVLCSPTHHIPPTYRSPTAPPRLQVRDTSHPTLLATLTHLTTPPRASQLTACVGVAPLPRAWHKPSDTQHCRIQARN